MNYSLYLREYTKLKGAVASEITSTLNDLNDVNFKPIYLKLKSTDEYVTLRDGNVFIESGVISLDEFHLIELLEIMQKLESVL